MTTFSALLKKDLGKLSFGTKENLCSELSGIINGAGTIIVDKNEKMSLSIKTENPSVARRSYLLIKEILKSKPQIKIEKTKKFKEHRAYLIILEDSKLVKKILTKTKILTYNSQGQAFFTQKIPEGFTKTLPLKKSYLRGTFLGCGSISNPEKTYHLELVGKRGPQTKRNQTLESIKNLLEEFQIKPNLIYRKSHWVLYLKEGESVSNFLNVIEGHRGLLQMENIRIVKEMRNDVNRQVNCETANMNKTVNASFGQTADILYLKEKLGLSALPKNLYDIAEIRLNYPDDSIKELGERLDPPVGKSGVYHRLKKLGEMADELRSK
ncbi:MAG: DNA-binding protein WhiA [Eubacteriaceae bacterium]